MSKSYLIKLTALILLTLKAIDKKWTFRSMFSGCHSTKNWIYERQINLKPISRLSLNFVKFSWRISQRIRVKCATVWLVVDWLCPIDKHPAYVYPQPSTIYIPQMSRRINPLLCTILRMGIYYSAIVLTLL